MLKEYAVMNFKFFLSFTVCATLSLVAQESTQPAQAEPTNEQIVAFLSNTQELTEKVTAVEISFIIQKGAASDDTWQAFIASTAQFIKKCLNDDQCSIPEFAPFIQSTCAQLDADDALEGTIAIDLTDREQPEDNQ